MDTLVLKMEIYCVWVVITNFRSNSVQGKNVKSFCELLQF